VRAAAQLLFSLLLVTFASTVAFATGLERARWDALLTVVIFLGMRSPTVAGGAAMAAAAGYLQDLCSGVPWGLTSAVYVLLFAGTRIVSQALHGEGVVFGAVFSLIGSLAGGLVSTMLYVALAPAGAEPGGPAYAAIVPTAILTALLSPIVFAGMSLIDRIGKTADAGLGIE
jgi:cell shape-determining protein MreD